MKTFHHEGTKTRRKCGDYITTEGAEEITEECEQFWPQMTQMNAAKGNSVVVVYAQ